MLKKLMPLFRAHSTRAQIILYVKRANYLGNGRFQASDFPPSFGHIKPIALTYGSYVKPGGGRSSGDSSEVNEKELGEAFNVHELAEDFTSPVESFKAMLKQQPDILSEQDDIGSIEFMLDGKMLRIEDVARIGKKYRSHYVVHFDGTSSAVPAAVHALQNYRRDWNIQQEGTKVHVSIPPIKNDERYILRKRLKSELEECREELTLVQNQYLRKLSKMDNLDTIMKRRLERQIKALTKELSKEAEHYLNEKLVQIRKED